MPARLTAVWQDAVSFLAGKRNIRSRDMGDGKVRTVGVAMAMQGSCISNVDVGSATVKLADDGTFNLIIGAADMGTGCDTILAQMVAECMDCSVDDVAVFGADTDASPYDSGSYASSTTYVTGKAVELACEELKKKLCAIAAGMLGCEPEETVFEDGCVRKINTDERVTLAQISVKIRWQMILQRLRLHRILHRFFHRHIWLVWWKLSLTVIQGR